MLMSMLLPSWKRWQVEAEEHLVLKAAQGQLLVKGLL